MGKESSRPKKYYFRLVITPAGTVRSESELRKDVTEALKEATEQFREETGAKDVHTEGAPQGGFLGLGAEWPWIISVLSPIVWDFVKEAAKAGAGEIGKEGAKGLFSLLKEALRKRNLSAGTPDPLPNPASNLPVQERKSPATKKKQKPSPKKKGRKSR